MNRHRSVIVRAATLLLAVATAGALAVPALAVASAPTGTVSIKYFGVRGVRLSETTSMTTALEPVVASLPDGATVTTYSLPDGEVISSTTPPSGFDPLTASDSQLAEYAFPPRPSDTTQLQDWTTAMSAYKSDGPSEGPLQIAAVWAPSVAIVPTSFATYYLNWGGYVAGTLNTHNHTYVAVKGVLTVPSNTGTCLGTNSVGFWIGLGGWNNGANDLDQQGIECGYTPLGSGSAYRPFTEFASTAPPVNFCGYSSWTLPAGHVIYQNMSFQASANRGYFYLEDETSGVAHSCSATPPSGWTYNGNVADWIGEAPYGTAVNFHPVRFTDANAELNSNSSWVALGTQTVTKTIAGSSPSTYCISPGSIGSDKASFSDSWHQANCY